MTIRKKTTKKTKTVTTIVYVKTIKRKITNTKTAKREIIRRKTVKSKITKRETTKTKAVMTIV